MASPRGDQPITILFTDVQGSIQLRARHGDRVADELLHDHEGIVRRAIGANGGEEAAFLGDGFMATFATALTTAEALGNRIEQVDLGFWRARMLRTRDGPGDQEAATALATDVSGRYRDLGLARHADIAGGSP
jgi:class 3 adenylate cyclase